jgi:superfamily I DNA/RNA helicase
MTQAIVSTWSPQQTAIFDWFGNRNNSNPNLVVRARAGTGKTTTIVKGVEYAPEQNILFCAFNKKIAQELTTRVATSNPNAQAQTLHALGYATVRRFKNNLKLDTDSRADGLTEKVCGNRAPDTVKRLVSKLHTLGREIAPHATALGQLTNLAIAFECVPEDVWEAQGYGIGYVEQKALDAMELASNVESGGIIDYSDMIFLPVRNGWLHPTFDLVVVDEAQDMTTAQLEIAQGVCKGRICVVGDDRQAIYGFRGADSDSLDRLKLELQAEELGLTTTYRCGKRIVAEAQVLVPDFMADDSNSEGEIQYLDSEKLTAEAAAGDFILSRVNAPLVSIAMKLLRSGKRTRIAGRDIGAGLKALVRKLKGRTVPDLLSKISAWEARELARLSAQRAGATNGRAKTIQSKMDAIADQAEMLLSLADGARNVDEITARIDGLFTDDGLGDAGVITCSSVHKSKGLEADRVFVLKDTLKAHSQEELNITYVAITRAKNTLVYVTKEQK